MRSGATRGRVAHPLSRRYTRKNILLLLETEEPHGNLSGPAMLALFQRAREMFANARYERYERLARLSNGHLRPCSASISGKCFASRWNAAETGTPATQGTRGSPENEAEPSPMPALVR